MGQARTVSISVAPEGRLPSPGFLTWVAELVHGHRARLLRYARRRGLGPEDALDVVQDSFASFLALPEAHSIARIGDDALKLLTVITRHNILNRRRKRVRRDSALEVVEQLFPTSTESDEELVGQSEQLTRVYGCLARMNGLQRAVIMLSALDERPGEDVATVLGIAPGHVRVLLHRARAHVRACPLDEMPALSAQDFRDATTISRGAS
jgi:RNA polymerase sigma-70 factor (ECF subfamily)